jgi:hypothetical protein
MCFFFVHKHYRQCATAPTTDTETLWPWASIRWGHLVLKKLFQLWNQVLPLSLFYTTRSYIIEVNILPFFKENPVLLRAMWSMMSQLQFSIAVLVQHTKSMKGKAFEYTTPTDGGNDLLMYASLAHSFTFLAVISCDYRPCKVRADGSYLFPYWVAKPAVPHLRSYCLYKSIRIFNSTLYSLTDFMLLYHMHTSPTKPILHPKTKRAY